jgi:hypothetical protein
LRIALRLVFILGEEEHAHSQRLLGAQKQCGLGQKKITWDSSLNADTIAALAVGGDRAAMGEATERRQRKAKNFMFGAAVQGRNKANAAGVVIEAGTYEVLATRGKTLTTHSPLYMEEAVQMKGEFNREEKCGAVFRLWEAVLWHSSVGWPIATVGNVQG